MGKYYIYSSYAYAESASNKFIGFVFSLGGLEMPIYEFRCKDCGCEFEEICRTFEWGDVKCPSCRSPNVEKLFSPPVIGISTISAPTRELDAKNEEIDYYEKRKDYGRAARAAERVGKKEKEIKDLYRKAGESAK